MGAAAKPTLLALFLVVVSLGVSQAQQFTLPALRYAYGALEPFIDTETMTLHHTRHHNASVTNLNNALPRCDKADCGGRTLTQLMQNINGLSHSPADVQTTIRNHGGSHFNHAMYWRTLCGNTDKNKCKPSKHLDDIIYRSFGNFTNMRTELEASAGRLFGSGWTWLIYDSNSKLLKLVNIPNQDNPLMPGAVIGEANKGIPILGIDLWEHAFYLKHRNVRANYVKLWWDVVDWHQVSENYKHATQNKLEGLWRD